MNNQKRPKAKPLSICSLAPVNQKEQEQLFFANHCMTNPVFKYSSKNVTQYVTRFNPSEEYLPEATRILDTCMAEFGTESHFLQAECGDLLTVDETQDVFDSYISKLKLRGKVTLIFSEQAIAPTTIVHYKKTSQVIAALPLIYRREKISGVFHHEIGTHLVRTYNERKQVWAKKRQTYQLKPFLETEEGFAALNTNIDACKEGQKPYLWRSALHYYASYQAARMSFVELYNDLAKYIDDPLKRYKEVLRVKRGLEDTAQPGGCYKDQVYLSGAIKVLRARREIDFMTLISGKLSLEDHFRPEIRRRAVVSGILVPPFLHEIPNYIHKLDMLAHINKLD